MSNFQVKKRLFKIWLKTGMIPGHKSKEKEKKSGFFSGSLEGSIPFLNDDAKRTFVHLLLRPGYMMRDYLRGKSDIYLAPLTSLLVFYAFFNLIASILSPSFKAADDSFSALELKREELVAKQSDSKGVDTANKLMDAAQFARQCVILMNLDLHPEAVDSKQKASLASMESTLRSQGIQEFLGMFIILWGAIWIALRRRCNISLSAAATISAYVLCQYCFFRIFTVLVTLGHSKKLGWILMVLLMAIDLRQLLGINWKRAIALTIVIFLSAALLIGLFFLLISGILYLKFF